MDWTQEEVEQVKKAYLSGLSVAQIAGQIGRSEKSVRNKLARSNISLGELKSRVPKDVYYDNCKIICPFFLEFQNGKSITCEGIVSKTVTVLKFTEPKAFSEHMASFCNSDFKKCPIAVRLFEKWE